MMSAEFARTTDETFSQANNQNQEEDSATFVWDFNLNDIDPDLIFDESVPDQNDLNEEQQPVDPKVNEEQPPTFAEWLNNTVPDKEEDQQQSEIPQAFQWAKKESVKTSERLANVSFGGLSAIGGALGSLMSVVGACGPICFHALGSMASAGSSGLSMATPGFGGLNMSGFSVDKNGNFRLSGNIDALSQATGLSREALLSGKYSAQDILTTFFSILGEGICCIFCFGLIEVLINGLIPQPKAT
jgi:hypothetical protein